GGDQQGAGQDQGGGPPQVLHGHVLPRSMARACSRQMRTIFLYKSPKQVQEPACLPPSPESAPLSVPRSPSSRERSSSRLPSPRGVARRWMRTAWSSTETCTSATTTS